MINIKNGLAAIVFLSGMSAVNAQSLSPEVVSSSGGFLGSTGGSVSYTIGEPVSETFTAGGKILTQGFQQPFTISLTGIPESSGKDEVYAYPNPVKDELTIDFTSIKAGAYIFRIFDVAGKEVADKKIQIGNDPFTEKISLSGYQNGIYYIDVIAADQSFHKVFQLIKQN